MGTDDPGCIFDTVASAAGFALICTSAYIAQNISAAWAISACNAVASSFAFFLACASRHSGRGRLCFLTTLLAKTNGRQLRVQLRERALLQCLSANEDRLAQPEQAQ